MKKTLLKKILKIKKLLFHQFVLLFLLLPGFTFAKNLSGNSIKQSNAVNKNTNAIDFTLKGIVTDRSDGQPMPGVSVKIKGTTMGVVTDIHGSFSLNVADNATLVFSYIGYDSLEISVNGQSNITVTLQSSSKSLNEVVVIGYGTQKKSSLTAAVSTINASEIAQKPVINITNALVGRASGLIITQGSGEPGFDGSNIQIRGTGSIGRTTPLYIVDGVPADFSLLDPNTVENISVLKDAAAVAPYGVAGANGVILITTKRGKSGKPVLTYNGYYGIQNPTRVPTFVNSFQYAQMRNEAATNDGTPVPYTAQDLTLFQNHTDPDGHPDGHPLQQIIMKNRPIQYDNLSLSGGNQDIRYFAALGYNHQDGSWSTNNLSKYNGTLNLTANPTKSTIVALSVNSYVEDGHYSAVGAGSIIDQAQRQAPTSPIYYSNGLWSNYIGQSLIGEIYHSGYTTNENSALISQLSIEQKLPLKGLSLKGLVSYNTGPDPLFLSNQTSFSRTWRTPIPFYNVNTTTTPYTYAEGFQGGSKPSLTETYTQNHMLTYQGLLNYAGSFGKSDISAVAVVESRNVSYNKLTAFKQNYNLNIDELDYGSPLPTDATNGGSSSGEKSIGFVYRVDYAYDKKYLLGASGRYDGNYLFAPGHRFGFFPAFSAGWRVSEEKFIKDNFIWIDNLKLRGSYGQSGAYPSAGGNIQTYQYSSQYSVSSASGILGNNITQGVYESLQGNPNITWEKSNKTDVGLEASFWKGVLNFEADYFVDKRSNMLVAPTAVVPQEYGIGLAEVNGGSMINKGFDLTVSSYKNFSKDLRLDVTGTFTYAKNKLLQVFENNATYNNPNRRQTGRAFGEQFGLKALGYFTPADFVNPNAASPVLKPGIAVPTFGPVHPGDIQYADLDHNGKIDANDITDIGKPSTPQIIYGLEPRLTFKHFDLDVLFQGAAGSSTFVNNYFVWPFQSSGSATALAYSDHWTPTNTNALYPRLSGTPTSNNIQESTWWMRNTAYLRMKSFEVGYTFSNSQLGHSIKSLRVYAAGQNLFTWTPYVKELLDPENSGNNETYYQQQVFSIGLNASF